jgi:hypothetical protein
MLAKKGLRQGPGRDAGEVPPQKGPGGAGAGTQHQSALTSALNVGVPQANALQYQEFANGMFIGGPKATKTLELEKESTTA